MLVLCYDFGGFLLLSTGDSAKGDFPELLCTPGGSTHSEPIFPGAEQKWLLCLVFLYDFAKVIEENREIACPKDGFLGFLSSALSSVNSTSAHNLFFS